MGIKVKHRISGLLFLGVMLIALPADSASFQPFIPAETLKIAHEAEVRASQLKPASEVVRVGIGKSGFTGYDYTEVSIFGTDGIQLYNNGEYNFIITECQLLFFLKTVI